MPNLILDRRLHQSFLVDGPAKITITGIFKTHVKVAIVAELTTKVTRPEGDALDLPRPRGSHRRVS